MCVNSLTFLLLFSANLRILVRCIELTQANLAAATPGDVFTFDKELFGIFKTSAHGTKENPISIRGIGENAIINGFNVRYGYTICMLVRHDYYILENFIIKECDKGMQAYGASHGIIRNVIAEYITNIFFQLRFHSSYWLVDSCIARFNRDYSYGAPGEAGKYGEGFYVGSAYNNRFQYGQTGEMDETHHITFLNCFTIDTTNDGYDVKEGSTMIKYVNSVASWTGPSSGDENMGMDGFYIRADKVSVTIYAVVVFVTFYIFKSLHCPPLSRFSLLVARLSA